MASSITTTNNKFRISGKRYFLTYAQCGVTKEECLHQIQSRYPQLKYWIVSQEKHQDGSFHLHAVFEFATRFQTRNERCFDLLQENGSKSYHPNIKTIGTAHKDIQLVSQYVMKEDKSPLTNITDLETYFRLSQKETKDEAYSAALTATDKVEARKLLMEADPKSYFKSFISINAALGFHFPEAEKPYVPPVYDNTIWDVPPEFIEWQNQIGSNKRCWLLIVIGETMCGKTTYFRSIGNHIHLKGLWNVEPFLDKKKKWDYVIFDDIDWERMDQYMLSLRSIFLGDQSTTVTDKYVKKVNINCQGKPCVILANEDMAVHLEKKFKIASYQDQVKFVNVFQKLYIPCVPPTPPQNQIEKLCNSIEMNLINNALNEWESEVEIIDLTQ